ncbi:non-canonical purine NTP diphosphatase [Rapidithrix thailandica]|uniref:dITP/XTP pyrophosphatase n=1 Tax=Rapidithrix thailandica TaxID=413964 RepID=A0AAW9RW38_9BACT
MKKICFATNNPNKLREIRQALEGHFNVVGMQEIGCTEDIPEPYDTLEENSNAKAVHIWEKFQIDCFGDDTGLEVEALNNAPGVLSARYAGEQKDNNANIRLLLKNLAGKPHRKARFRTVITLYLQGKSHQFEGIVNGHITEELRGEEGFGYDPVFVPEGHTHTFAEMSLEEKNKISHRGKAVQQLISFLKNV